MPETKAYLSDEWTRNAVTIQVREGEGRHARMAVVERPTSLERHAPMLRMVPALDLMDDDGAPRSDAPHPGIMLPVDTAEAMLVALLAWSSSTPGDNPVERARRAQGERDLALAEVAQLRHDLAVAEARVEALIGASALKDDRWDATKAHLEDVRAMWLNEGRRVERLEAPPLVLRQPMSSGGISGAQDVHRRDGATPE